MLKVISKPNTAELRTFPKVHFLCLQSSAHSACKTASAGPVDTAFLFPLSQSYIKEVRKLKKGTVFPPAPASEKSAKKRFRIPIARLSYHAFVCTMLFLMFTQPAYAATDVWTKASEIMKDVYNQIVLISTVAAIVTASVALLMMNFSRSGRTVDESRAWLKRICITWAILNGLGFIMAYITPFFADGKWTG